MSFNIQAAKQAGYTDQEIQQFMQQQQAYKPNLLNGVLSTGGAIAGGMMGGAGGAALGALVPGADLTGVPEVAGAYVGGVAGAGAGAGAGNAAGDFIRGLGGDKTVSPQQTLKDTPGEIGMGALSQAIGLPFAKGAGYIVHPIAPFIGRVNDILAKSGKEINVGEVGGLLDKFKNEVLPEFNKKGMGVEANQAYSDLVARVTNMVTAMKPHVESTSMQDINKLTLPIKDANQMKRNLYDLAKTSYGYIAQPGQEAIKQFARLTKNDIAKQEPGVNIPNAIASSLYKIGEGGPGLMKILSLGQPTAAHALTTMTGFPLKALQKTIPAGGGVLNQLFPGLLQSGQEINRQNDAQ